MQIHDIHEASTAHAVPISQDLAASPPAVHAGQQLAERYVVGERTASKTSTSFGFCRNY